MIACWINRNDGYGLLNDSRRLVGEIVLIPNQIHGRQTKRLYEPTRWFKMDGHKSIGKPPDRDKRKGA
ncbi:hypothetical protein [Paenibacillus dakarensis]|uniref:hypothetical protein n=1 Tax=Paenibacillus dakarensis TaxID=1527293 RepID=UPI0006D57FB4|nr:hypothetical protein [Paenibacillus dakarensis]